METMLPNLGVVTNFFMINYRYLSVGFLWVKEKSIRFYAREFFRADNYKDALIINISPEKIETVYYVGISEAPISDGLYAFHWTHESFGKWKKIDSDDHIASIIHQTLFGEEIREILEDINETLPTLYKEASGVINLKMFSENNLLLIKNTITSYFPGTEISNSEIIKDNHLPLFLKADLNNKDKKILPRTYVQAKPFLLLREIFKDKVFINPDKPAAPVIFGEEEPSALLFPPSWAEELIVSKNKLKG
jgi:hypothetical protein